MFSENVEYTQNGAGQYVFDGSLVGIQVDITYSISYAATWVSALGQLGLSLANGRLGQSVWSWLQSFAPAQALAYSGIAYCYADAYPLTNQAELENHSFEIITGHSVSSTVPDCWPDVILRDFLVTNSSSVGWRAGRLASMQSYKDYVRARQLWLSVSMEEQKPARDWMQALADISNAQWTWQGGLLDLVPRGDEAITSSYGSFAPSITPVFDLAYGEGGDILQPVEITPKVNEDAFNIIKIEWTNRANNYAIEVMTATDMAHIELFGERPKDVQKMHAIHDPAVAQSVAQQLLQREMTVWNEYKFKCPFSRALLGLMDLVTLTDDTSALDRVPVRIIAREEDGNDQYSFTAEDAPIGSASAPLYGNQAGAGFAHDYNAAPGSVAPPVIFEAPTERTSTGLEVYAAVSGQAGSPGALWGGCTVWVSLDGLSYRSQGRLYGGARYGQLTAAMGTSGSVAISLAGRGGQLLSGSADDAAALSTLCWVFGPQGGEYFSYQTATLTATNAYTLSSLTRGAYQNPVQTHALGAAFVRVDESLASSGPLTDEIIGKTIYFKFTSFNVYGGGEQALADVAAYTYTVTAEQLSLPPPNVQGASLTLTSEGVRASWQIFTGDYKDTWLRRGADWATATQLGSGGEVQRSGTSYLVGWLPAGLNTIVLKHRDRRDVQSLAATSASITIAAPASVQLIRSDVDANTLSVRWLDSKTSQPILRYYYKIGTTAQSFGAASDFGSAGADSRSDVLVSQSAGLRRVWFVAVDVAGNESAPISIDVNFSLPTDFVLASRFDATFAGTGTNAIVNAGRVYLLSNDEQDGTHFSSRGWTNDQDAISAGNPLYFQPGTTTASYSEDYDLGSVLATTTIKLTVQTVWLAGGGTIETDIATKVLVGDPWTTVSNVNQLVVGSFRYLRVTVRASAIGGDDLAQLLSMFTECSLKRLYEPFSLVLNAADAGGTPYVTTAGFVDIQSATASPDQASTNIVRGPYYTIDDAGATKRVLWTAFDNTGTRVSGTISGQISGV